MSAPTFFIVAGELSGDLHGSRLIQALKNNCPDAKFVGHGGDRMAAEKMEVLEHVDNLSVMGFTEVFKHLPYFVKIMGETLGSIREKRPDRIILIDYPGFNLRLAKKIYGSGIPVTYFILPQVWAWKESRVKILKKHVDQALCIFPFEQSWFEERGVPTAFVGHPFNELDMAGFSREDFCKKHQLTPEHPILTLLPGSRQQEINKHWPIFLRTVDLIKKSMGALQIVVGKASGVKIPPAGEDVCIENENPREAILHGTAALVASGTATLECAVIDTPAVVCYRLSDFSFSFIRSISKVPFASIVNVIAEREIIPEFLQNRMTPENLTRALLPLLDQTRERKSMLLGFEEVRRTLGMPGVYERAAEAILKKTTISKQL